MALLEQLKRLDLNRRYIIPYIKKEFRKKYSKILEQLPDIESKGDLEYCVYYLMQKYMENKEFRYSVLHDCTYAVQHCSDEFRRRNLDVRENEARDKNGDV